MKYSTPWSGPERDKNRYPFRWELRGSGTKVHARTLQHLRSICSNLWYMARLVAELRVLQEEWRCGLGFLSDTLYSVGG